MSEKSPQSTFPPKSFSEIFDFLKSLKDEQKLPALIILVIVISLTYLVLNSNDEKILYLYLIVVLLSFCCIFFLLFFQDSRLQEKNSKLQKLEDEKKTLQLNNTDMEKKINSTREKIYKSNKSMLHCLVNIEKKINNMKTNVDGLLSKGKLSERDANEIGNQLTYIIEDINNKKREFDNLNHRISSANNTFNTKETGLDMLYEAWNDNK